MIGWEYHAYLLQKRGGVKTIYEPTDNVVRLWTPGVFGITKIKVAYAVTVKRRAAYGVQLPVLQPVVLTECDDVSMDGQ